MKSYKSIYLFFLLFLGVGCSEDFLDRPDLDNITTDSFWQTPNDLNLYVIQFYTSLPSWNPGEWSGGIYWDDDNSDNLLYFDVNTRLAGNNTITSGNGNWSYDDIRALNIFFANYKTVSAPFEEVQQYVGEAHFFRAFYYFGLLRNYGSVPWITEPLSTDSEQLYSERTPRNVLTDSILAELDNAISLLPPGEQSNGNRLNNEIAMIFKSRVALYEGTWEKYHANTPFGVEGSTGEKYLEIAAQTAEQLIDNPGGYGIHNTGDPMQDYWELFNQTSYTGHTEVMLWRDYDVDLGIAHNGQRYLPRIGGGRGLTQNLVDAYLCTDGQPISLSDLYQGDEGLLNVAANRDPRLHQSLFLPGDPMEVTGGEVLQTFEKAPLGASGSAGCPTGYMIYKGANPDPNQYFSGGVGTTSSPIFRFAEVLLNFAEAKAELGTITQADLDKSVNIMRARVDMPNLTLDNISIDPEWLFSDLSPIINEIRRERQVEFALEGHRFDDLMRWQAADEVIVGQRLKGAYFIPEEFPDLVVGTDVLLDENGYIDPHQGQVPNGFEFNTERDYLLPLPLDEITLNPDLTQNPGW